MKGYRRTPPATPSAAYAPVSGSGYYGLTPTSKTSAYTAVIGDFVLADTTSAGFTVTLPTNPAAGTRVGVKKTDSSGNTLTIAPAGGGTIDGDSNATTTTKSGGAIFTHVGSNVWQISAVTLSTGPAGPTGATGPTGPTGPTGSTGAAGSNGAISQLQDEGSNLTVRPTTNFVGAGVTATDDAANTRTLVTIPGGGGGSALTVQDEGSPLTTAADTLNFVGSGVTATGTGATKTITIAGGGDSVPAFSGKVSGQWYSTSAGTGSGHSTLTAGTLYALPVYLPTGLTITFFGTNTSTGTTGESLRVGLYDDTGNHYPNALLTSAVIDLAVGSGVRTIALGTSYVVPSSGLYWLAGAKQGATNTATTVIGPIQWTPHLPVQTSDLYTRILAFTQTGVTGALPSTFSTTVTPYTSSSTPIFSYKVA